MPTQKENENDIILVANPDVGCEDVSTEFLGKNPDGTDIVNEYNHRDYFQVRWGGSPHRIPPGQTRRMPRFLAEHFAKHLADHILTKREDKEKRQGLVQSATERPKVLKSILLNVETYFLAQDEPTEGTKVSQMVDGLNKERTLDLGVVPNPAIGVLKPEPPSLDDILAEVKASEKQKEQKEQSAQALVSKTVETLNKQTSDKKDTKATETSVWDNKKALPSKEELLKDCYDLGIEVTGKEAPQELVEKIKQFSTPIS